MNHKKLLRQIIMISVALIALLFLLPLAVIKPFREQIHNQISGLSSGKKQEQDQAQKKSKELPPFSPGELDAQTILKVLDGDTVQEMDLGTYLTGVVRAEMPASFEPEALKAQASAARTYTLHNLLGGSNHGNTADICTDSTCCQAYISREQALANWGENASTYEEKIESAVRETDGQTILYGGVPILAVFHSCSAGRTRSAGDVWQDDLPYLQPVSSPEPSDRIPNYYSRTEFSAEEFREKILASKPDADLSGPISDWLKNPVLDDSGSVETVEIGGVSIRGTAVRSILELRSACFEWEVQDNSLVFFVTGYGHGVGMSQYGAEQMAQDGADYQEILTHYYTGVTVEPYQK